MCRRRRLGWGRGVELRRGRKSLHGFKLQHPYCCYCGGHAPTEQKEHAPPKILFRDKWRPDQLVVPACNECNQSFAQTDQIVACLARVTRSWTKTGLDEDRLQSILNEGISRNHPELFEEWAKISPRQRRRMYTLTGSSFREAPALNSGPHTQKHLQAFGARLAFALHYHHTKRIIPKNGGVIVEIMTLQHQLNGWRLPDELSAILGPPRTLAQGKKHLAEQFIFCCGMNAAITFYFATFGRDFAFVLFVAEDRSDFDSVVVRNAHVHTPGNFFKFPMPFSLGPIRFQCDLSGILA